jgi:hypothetical protein
MAISGPTLKIRTGRLVHDGSKLQSPWGRSPEQWVQGRWRAVATAFSGQPHEFLRSTVLPWNARSITGQSPLPNPELSALLPAIILWVADYENARHSTSSESPVSQTSTPRLNRNEPPAARLLSYPALYAAHLQ